MKVLYGIGGLGTGGAERQLLYLAEGIAERADVTIVSLSPTLVDLLPAFSSLRGVRVVVCAKRSRFDLALVPRLVRLLRRERPVIVHSFLRTANYWVRLAAVLARVPIRIASERNIEVERGVIANTFDRLLALVSDRIVVNAEAIRDRLIQVERISAARIDVIPNGVPSSGAIGVADVTTSRREVGCGQVSHLIGFVGRLVPQKNPRLFLEMAHVLLKAHRKCGFVIVGDGPMREDLQAEVDAAGLHDAVRFLGMRSDVPRILGLIDVLVLTSDWEGLPNVVLEAQAAGVPVVATSVGGVPELIDDGVNGFTVPARDATTLSERVMTLLDDPGLRTDFARSGRTRALQCFSVEDMIGKTVQLYDAVLRSRGLPLFSARVRRGDNGDCRNPSS
jgi:glycosyltransferase involved in cell wall biosynthesis